MIIEHTKLSVREQVWLAAWTAVAQANDCKDADTASNWAEECLAQFDKTFTKHK